MSAPVEIPTGYTPGPWKVRRTIREVATAIDAQYACINGLSAWFGIARIDRPGEQEVGYTDGAYDAEVSDANARLIALAPQMAAELLALRADVTRLTASLAAAEGEAGRLREALTFYGNKAHWETDEGAWEAAEQGDLSEDTLSGLISAVEEDGGKKARAALTGAAS